MRKQVLAFIVAMSAAANAATVDRSVFGLALGERLSVPECSEAKWAQDAKQKGIRSADAQPVYDVTTDRACFQKWQPDGRTEIMFPDAPALSSSYLIEAIVLDNKLEGISFSTRGVYDADHVLRKLTDKYGKPSKLERESAKNLTGATLDTFRARWQFDNLFVEFQSTTLESADSGTVTIETSKGHEKRITDLAAAAKQVRPL